MRFQTFLCLLLLTSCSSPHPLRGGRALTSPTAGGLQQSLSQGENPSAPTRQDQSAIRVRTYTLPAGSRIEQVPPVARHPSNTPTLQRMGPAQIPSSFSLQPSAFFLSSPTTVSEREETHASTQLGAAQKDTARELGAKLTSLKPIVWVGLALFIFGLTSLFWPPLKLLIGSLTTSAAITLGGVALMLLPTFVVGNELLIFGGVALAVGAWFLAHRHGHLRGLVDANQNGIDDRLEPEERLKAKV